MTEIEPCPKCGALPCDWTDNPHTAPSGDEVDRLVSQLKAEHQRNGGQGAYAWQSRELCGKAAAALSAMRPASGVFAIGDRVTKIKGSGWTGRVVGTYSTTLTPEGYAVESENELGSVQIYPATALRQAGEV